MREPPPRAPTWGAPRNQAPAVCLPRGRLRRVRYIWSVARKDTMDRDWYYQQLRDQTASRFLMRLASYGAAVDSKKIASAIDHADALVAEIKRRREAPGK